MSLSHASGRDNNKTKTDTQLSEYIHMCIYIKIFLLEKSLHLKTCKNSRKAILIIYTLLFLVICLKSVYVLASKKVFFIVPFVPVPFDNAVTKTHYFFCSYFM